MPLLEIMIVAGEASGDRLAADLVAEIRKRLREARFFGMGGPLCAVQGVDLIYGAQEISVLGITEVIPKLRRILEVLGGLEQAAARRQPVCAVRVDVPDFNLLCAIRLEQ